MEKLIDLLIKHLNMSEEDAIAAAVFAYGGFVIDMGLLHVGIPPGTFATLSGVGGFLFSKVNKKTPWYRNRALNRIDKLVKKGQVSEGLGKELKMKLIRKWYDDNDPKL